MKKVIAEYEKLKKYPLARRSGKTYKTRLEKFQNDIKLLFDLSFCKCKKFEACTCERSKKVPLLERSFLCDQRKERKMIIAGIDRKTTAKLKLRNQRRMKGAEQRIKSDTITRKEDKLRITSSSSSENGGASSSSEDFQIASTSAIKSRQSRMKLPKFTLLCDRVGVSDRAAAMLATAVMDDTGALQSQGPSAIVDRSKIRRLRKDLRTAACEIQRKEKKTLLGLYFDGRKDKTLVNLKKGKGYHRSVIVEEHISLVDEPGSSYLAHITTESGTAISIKNSIVNFITQSELDVSKFNVVGCDGTAVNTGSKGGVIALLEKKFKRPFQWVICLIHSNELPLRHLIQKLDGATTGPLTFSGPIGAKLETCQTLPIVPFIPLQNNLPLMSDPQELQLSTDQNYLLEIVNAVATGIVSESLSHKSPGKLSHARWLTAANRILRLYVSTRRPSRNLKILSEYIVRVYAPVWFHIRLHPTIKDGPKHLFQLITLSRYLPQAMKAIIDPIITRNSFFAHPENLLLAMLYDDRPLIQQVAQDTILQARAQATVREKFQVPLLNFDAGDYVNLIDWEATVATEPPLLRGIELENLSDMDFPCHTQAVERCVKLVTEASSKVCGAENRHGYILNLIAARIHLPTYHSKQEYPLHL